jgi:hypothetical protein
LTITFTDPKVNATLYVGDTLKVRWRYSGSNITAKMYVNINERDSLIDPALNLSSGKKDYRLMNETKKAQFKFKYTENTKENMVLSPPFIIKKTTDKPIHSSETIYKLVIKDFKYIIKRKAIVYEKVDLKSNTKDEVAVGTPILILLSTSDGNWVYIFSFESSNNKLVSGWIETKNTNYIK